MKLKPSRVLNEEASVEEQKFYHLLCLLLHLLDKSNCTITFHTSFFYFDTVSILADIVKIEHNMTGAQSWHASFPLTNRTGICFSLTFSHENRFIQYFDRKP